MCSNEISKSLAELETAINGAFQDLALSLDIPIAIRKRNTKNSNGCNLSFSAPSEGNELEYKFRGGTEEGFRNDLYDDNEFCEFISNSIPVKWSSINRLHLEDWFMGSYLSLFLPQARAYYLPGFIIKFSSECTQEIKDEDYGGIYAVADILERWLLPPDAWLMETSQQIISTETISVWDELLTLDNIAFSPFNMTLPKNSFGNTSGKVEYLSFIGQLTKKQRKVVSKFVEFGINVWYRSLPKLTDDDKRNIALLERVWLMLDFDATQDVTSQYGVWGNV
jgi:hypothetical protein